MSVKSVVFVLALACLAGCDFITKAQGVMELAQEVGQNLEKDLKSPLTDAKIDKVLEVTPELVEFSKTAKETWKPDPQSEDIQQLATSLGAVSEYIAFFKARDTRLTEYYVDLVKICDVRWQVVYSEANAEAQEKLAQRIQELEADTSLPAEEKQKALEQARLAKQQLEQAKLKDPEATPDQPQGGKNSAYTLSDEERALVTARLPEITRVLRAAGYLKDQAAENTDGEPVESADPAQPGE